jgi:ATP-dependent HslUV protease ATP-binding subunit HslU
MTQKPKFTAKNPEEMGLTPKEIVNELDRYIIGQSEAKKSVALALRNRYRRKNVEESLREEIVPKNILMVGPTGVGKTEIARRLAKLASAPFIKVEATKFTEVGYVGRDVESIIRDLVEIAINMLKSKAKAQIQETARDRALERVLDSLVGKNATQESRDKFKDKISSGEMDDTEVEVKVKETSSSGTSFDIPGMPGASMDVMNISDMLGKAMGSGNTKDKKMRIEDAMNVLTSEESDKLIDNDKIIQDSLKLVENDGIIFLDELDKIASKEEGKGGEVSREGVQRDLLPLIEGTSVSTKHGTVKTDHMLFIASGAFHLSKPSELLPELQGRLPTRVELKSLSEDDMVRILKEPEASLIKQYIALLETENLEVEFTEDGIKRLASIATEVNTEIENIGARRLHTLMEKLLEEISFEASDKAGEKIVIDAGYVDDRLGSITADRDLSKFIL